MSEGIPAKSKQLSSLSGAGTLSSWSTLPKRLLRQLKYGENSLRLNNGSYNIENGALSIRKKDFPQLEVTIGSRTLERSSRGRDVSSVVLEPLGKSDHFDICEGSTLLFSYPELT